MYNDLAEGPKKERVKTFITYSCKSWSEIAAEEEEENENKQLTKSSEGLERQMFTVNDFFDDTSEIDTGAGAFSSNLVQNMFIPPPPLPSAPPPLPLLLQQQYTSRPLYI